MVRLSRLRVFEERSDTMRFTSRKACLFIAAVFSLSTLSPNFLSYVRYLPLAEVPKMLLLPLLQLQKAHLRHLSMKTIRGWETITGFRPGEYRTTHPRK